MRGSSHSPQVPITSTLYTPSHDAFTTLVNTAAAQQSLAVPNIDRRSGQQSVPRTDISSIRSHPKDKPSVEGLEKSLMEMHGRPRNYGENDMNIDMRNKSDEKMRITRDSPEGEPKSYAVNRPLVASGPEDFGFILEQRRRLELEQYAEMDRQRYSSSVNEHQNPTAISQPSLRFPREPFTREQFERELRQQSPIRRGSDHNIKMKTEDISELTPEMRNNMSIARPQVSELDNEASKLFSQSFQKDNPKTSSSRGQFTAANLIDAIITHQINSSTDSPNGKNIPASANPSSAVNNTSPPTNVESLFVRYKNPEKPVQTQYREEVVTIPDSPDPEKSYSSIERQQQISNTPTNDFSKNITLDEHIATIISKNYSSDSRTHPNAFIQVDSRTSPAVYGMPPMNVEARNPMPPVSGSCGMLEGIAAAAVSNAPSDSNSSITHSPPHSSWKLRKALQQDKEVKETDERQIIRIVQNVSPKEQRPIYQTPIKSSSPVLGHYVEPISPPSLSNENNVQMTTTFNAMQTTWSPTSGIQSSMSSRQFYNPDNSDASKHSQQNVSTSNQPNSNRTPQSQIGLSPLDYVKNRIVEVMRTTTDETSDEVSKRPNNEVNAIQRHNEKPNTEESDSKTATNSDINERVVSCPESADLTNKTPNAVTLKQEKSSSPPISNVSKSSTPVTTSSSSRPQSASPSSSQSATVPEDNGHRDHSLPKKIRKSIEQEDSGEAVSSVNTSNPTISASNEKVLQQSSNYESAISQSSTEDNDNKNKVVSNDSIHNISSSENTEMSNKEKSNWEVSSACNDDISDDKHQDSKQIYPDSPNSPGEMVIDESVSTLTSSSSPIDKTDSEFPPSSTTQSTQQSLISTTDLNVSANKKLIISSSSENTSLPEVPNQSHSVSSSVIELKKNPTGVSSGLSSSVGNDQTQANSNSTPQPSAVTTQSERYSPSNSANSVSSSGTNLFSISGASIASSNSGSNSSSLSQTAVNTSGGNDSKSGGRDLDNRLMAYNIFNTPFTVSSTAQSTPSIGTTGSVAEPLAQSTGSTIQSSAISASGTPTSTTNNPMVPQYEPLSDDE
jgi:hypothetical protein